MNKKYLFFIGCIILFSFVFFYFKKNSFFSEKSFWSFGEAVFLEYKNEGKGEKFLYEIAEKDKKIYLATNKKIEDQKELKLIHTSPFWDPEVCAGMQTLILDSFIISKEARLEAGEKGGGLIYKYFFYLYNKEKSTIEYLELPPSEVVVSPIFTDSQSSFYFFSKKDNSLFLKKITLYDKKITEKFLKELPLQESLEVIKERGSVYVLAKNAEMKKTTFLFSEGILTVTKPKEILYKNIVTTDTRGNKNSLTTQGGKYTLFTPQTFKVKFLGENTLYGYFEIFNLINFSDFSIVKIKKEEQSQELLYTSTSSDNTFKHLILGISENTTLH